MDSPLCLTLTTNFQNHFVYWQEMSITAWLGYKFKYLQFNFTWLPLVWVTLLFCFWNAIYTWDTSFSLSSVGSLVDFIVFELRWYGGRLEGLTVWFLRKKYLFWLFLRDHQSDILIMETFLGFAQVIVPTSTPKFLWLLKISAMTQPTSGWSLVFKISVTNDSLGKYPSSVANC